MTVLVPSYREDTRVIRQTLLSAALQEYPYLDIRLLVDDPPNPTNADHVAILEAARELPHQIAELLAVPAAAAPAALDRFEARPASRRVTLADAEELAELLRRRGGLPREPRRRPGIGRPHRPLLRRSHPAAPGNRLAHPRLGGSGLGGGVDHVVAAPSPPAISQPGVDVLVLARLVRAQAVRDPVHEPNKAMNLNSYIGLMGGSSRGRAAEGYRAAFRGPGAARSPRPRDRLHDTLDADSVLLPDYCLRLVHLLSSPATSGSRWPRPRTARSRARRAGSSGLAGATTDIQYIIHQGFTEYDATFWVGANAVLRKTALDDIMEVEHEAPGGRYIQDRTVIEDTESTSTWSPTAGADQLPRAAELLSAPRPTSARW